MDLIESYVRSVRLFLPKEQRDDIARELQEDLRSQAEDKQLELKRPLTESEQVALLRQCGHPMLMAARYRRARNLIGPVIFPIYWQVLKVALALVAATNLASLGLLATSDASWSELGAAVTQLLDNGLEVVVIVTLFAALGEWSLTRFKVLERWDPGSLSDGPMRMAERAALRAAGMQVRHTDSLVRRALDEAGPPLQVRSFAEFVMLAVLMCWGVLGLRFPHLIFANAANMLEWAPLVHRLFPAIVIVVVAALIDQYLRLTRQGPAFLGLMRVVWANAGWVMLVLLLWAPRQWVVFVGSTDQWARFGAIASFAGRTWSLVEMVNGIITLTLVVIALVSLVGPCWRLRRIFGRRIFGRRRGAHTVQA